MGSAPDDPVKTAALAALAERRPDLIHPVHEGSRLRFEVAPSDCRTLDPADAEGAEVMAAILAWVADEDSAWALATEAVAAIERAAAGRPTLAATLAAELRRAEGRAKRTTSMRGDLEQAARRLEAIAGGATCGCGQTPLPYRGNPERIATFQKSAAESPWKKLSQEGYIAKHMREVECALCGTRFRVNRTVDYDRPTYSWNAVD